MLSYGVSSIKPDDGRGEINGSKEVTSRFVVARGNSAVLLEFAEEVLNQVTCRIKLFVVFARFLAISFGWDNCRFSGFLQKIENSFVRVICLVSQQGIGLKIGQKPIRAV